jgi:hypothetical protein
MRDGPTLSSEGPAEEPASVLAAVTGCLPQAFVDRLLGSALEPGIVAIFEGTPEIQRTLIGRAVTGLDARS